MRCSRSQRRHCFWLMQARSRFRLCSTHSVLFMFRARLRPLLFQQLPCHLLHLRLRVLLLVPGRHCCAGVSQSMAFASLALNSWISHGTRGQYTSPVIPDPCPGMFPSGCRAPSDATRGCCQSAPAAGIAFSEFGHEDMVGDGVSPGVSCSKANDIMDWYLDPVPSTLSASPQEPSEVDSCLLFDLNTMDSSWHESVTPQYLATLPHVPELLCPDNGGNMEHQLDAQPRQNTCEDMSNAEHSIGSHTPMSGDLGTW